MSERQRLEDLTDVELLTRLIWGEARGESTQGKIAVACVARNRVEKNGWFGRGYKGVILKPWQFSCFNDNDPNLPKLIDPDPEDEAVKECRAIADQVIDGLPDVTGGATHYYATWMKEPPGWAKQMTETTRIGRHVFLKEA